MAQPTPDELAKMTLEELDALSPLEMCVGMTKNQRKYAPDKEGTDEPDTFTLVDTTIR